MLDSFTQAARIFVILEIGGFGGWGQWLDIIKVDVKLDGLIGIEVFSAEWT